MAPKASDANDAAGAGSQRLASTPRRELGRIRAAGEEGDPEVRRQITEAMLAACGELGYREVSVQGVVERYGGYRVQFYREFGNKAECYAAAYEAESEWLVEALLGAARAQPSWRGGLRAALHELARYASEQPMVARGLLVEVHAVGGPALTKREEMFERLTRAVDSARRETESRHSPPPITASFIVSAIEASVCSALERGEPQAFTAALQELARMVIATYFGDETAREELAALGAD